MTGALHPTLYALRAAFRDYAKDHAPDILSFCGDALFASHQERATSPQEGPATAFVGQMSVDDTMATAPLVAAVQAAAGHVAWRQSYSEGDLGFDANFLANYGWFNLIAPSGPFVSQEMRLAVGYWGRGLSYPRHWHAPEEIYLTLAGRATYISEGRADVDGGPGTTIAHYSNQPHAARFPDAPLLAAAFWRGDALEKTSALDAS